MERYEGQDWLKDFDSIEKCYFEGDEESIWKVETCLKCVWGSINGKVNVQSSGHHLSRKLEIKIEMLNWQYLDRHFEVCNCKELSITQRLVNL